MAYTVEDLLSVLHPHCPIKVDALCKNRRRVEHAAPLLFELLPNRRALHGRDAVLHRVLHLLEGAHLDLAHALARDAEFLG